jgi:UrcA family protein
MNRTGKIAAFALSLPLLTGVLLAGASARAADQDPTHGNVTVSDVVVAYGDLDLSKESGAEILFARIKRAAGKACGWQPDIRELAAMAQFDACRKQAMDTAITRIGAPKLSALYGRTLEEVASAR